MISPQQRPYSLHEEGRFGTFTYSYADRISLSSFDQDHATQEARLRPPDASLSESERREPCRLSLLKICDQRW